MSSYDPLTLHLNGQTADAIRLSFTEIETILGRKLPRSAMTHRAFWSNNASNNVMTRAWLAAGFQSEKVDLAGRALVFRRVEPEVKMPGFSEAQAPFDVETSAATSKFPLFGWQKGTITIAPGVDLTAPADPELGDYLDEKYGAYDPAS